jgi:hypothetical protein
MRIVTCHEPPPIPGRQFDWSAIDGDTYDGAPGTVPTTPIGWGATEGEAIVDLIDQPQVKP